MAAYILVYCLAAIPALLYWRRTQPAAWLAAGMILVMFVGLRHEVGGDWLGYILLTERITGMPPLEAAGMMEPMYSLLTWLSAQLGLGVYGVNLLGAAIFFFGLFAYCAKQPNRWLALAAAIPFLVIVAVMSANRQGIAIGIVMYAMSRWERLGIARRAAWILLAALFHVSALLLLVLAVADIRMSRLKKIFLLAFLGVASLWLLSRSETAWARYTTVYVEQSQGAYSPGAVFHLLLNLVPAGIMLAFRKRWSRLVRDWHLLQQLCILAFALLAFSPFMTVAVSRMSLYLFPISITFIAYLPQVMREGPGRALARLGCTVLLGVVLVAWLALSNTAFTYFPYQNALFLHSSELDLPR